MCNHSSISVVNVSDDEDDDTIKPEHPTLDHLRRVVLPLSDTIGDSDLPRGLDLGPEVEVWFHAHRVSADQQLAVLPPYIPPALLPCRFRPKKKGHVLTPSQKAQLKAERQQRNENVNMALEDARAMVWTAAKKMHADFQTHSAEYYYQLIMQTSRLNTQRRRASRWNAYLRKEMQRVNTALPEGEDHKRVSDKEVTNSIAAAWHSMSKEEQISATDDALKELEAHRENLKKGIHTVPIHAFHDSRSVTAGVLTDVHARTGNEYVLFEVRSDTSSYNRPFVFFTSQRLNDFFVLVTQNTAAELALKMEGYCISGGPKGVVHNYVQGLIQLKKDAASLINGKLHICSRPELETLINAFESGATRFRSLSDEEWAEWKKNRLAGRGNGSRTAGEPERSVTDPAPTSPSSTPAVMTPAASTPAPPEPTLVLPPAPSNVYPPAGTASSPAAPPSQTSPSANVPARKRARQETTFVTVDIITGPDGRSIPIAKRPRKPHGPGKAAASNSLTSTPDGSATAPATALTAQTSENMTTKPKKSRRKSKNQAPAPA
ncbi:hypothetical protein C8Q78DRAFT_994228 [Trametes maxima]|nr:hypothetical protein C8Q78DRAFT_994228 [Trametes maxima]